MLSPYIWGCIIPCSVTFPLGHRGPEGLTSGAKSHDGIALDAPVVGLRFRDRRDLFDESSGGHDRLRAFSTVLFDHDRSP